MKIYTILIATLFVTTVHAEELLTIQTPKKLSILSVTSPIVTRVSSDIICSYKLDSASRAEGFAASGFSVLKIYSCDQKNFAKSQTLSSLSCQMATACRNSLLQSEENVDLIETLANEFVAKEVVRWPLENSSLRMEKFEVLKAFAKEKYKKDIGKECVGKFTAPSEAGKCNLSFLDEAFIEYQDNCTLKNGCHRLDEQKGTLSFKSFNDKNKKTEVSKFTDYFNYRIGSKSKEALDGDKNFVDQLATFVTSAEFKKAGEDKKLELFEKFLTSNSTDVDPVLGFDLLSGNVSVKDGLKGLSKLTALFKNPKNKDSFIKEYENYRESRAKAIFDKRSPICESVNSVERICEQVTSIAGGKGMAKGKFLSIQKIDPKNLEKSGIIEQLQKRTNGKINPANADIVMNAYKCTAFKFDNSESSRKSPLGEDLAINSSNDTRLSLFGEGALGDPIPSYSKAVWEDDREFGEGSIASGISSSEEKALVSSSSSSISDRMEAAPGTEVSVAPSHDTPTSNISGANNNYDQYSQTAANAYNPLPSSASEESSGEKPAIANSGKGIATSAAASALADAAELEKVKARLAQAEANVQQLRTEAQAAKDKEVADKKIAEEEALVNDLKSQIADLKKKKEAKEAVAKVADIRSEDRDNYVQPATVYEPTRTDYYPATREREIIYEDRRGLPAAGYDGVGGRAIGASGSNGSGIMLTATKSGAVGERSVTLASGDVVITIDGLSAEAANEILKTNAIDAKGQSFLIEENGLIKEVFPKLNDKGELVYRADGTLDCDKLVRGRIGDKKYAKAKIVNKREPAAVAAPADVKKRDDNVRERIQLKDLDKLIKSAGQ